jgi:hypothetical protein
MSDHLCPKCGKPMVEQPKFPGLWMCPDGKIFLNDSPPFRRLCEGMELTDEGAELFDAELRRQWSERN